jgi:DNA-binding response OmpR family regulator
MKAESILIVDDEELIRETLRLDLLDQGYAVDAVASGEEALRMLDRGYELVVTDLLMEGMNGLEVLRRVKECDPQPAVFILTGHRELEAAIGALRLGADDYLIKPHEHSEMINRVASCLQERAALKTKQKNDVLIHSICSECKKMRAPQSDAEGRPQWVSFENFLRLVLGCELSHGICPDCYQKKMVELNEMIHRGQLFRRP